MLIGGIIAGNVTTADAASKPSVHWQYVINESTDYNDARYSKQVYNGFSGKVHNGRRSTVHQARIKAYNTYNSSLPEYYEAPMNVYGKISSITIRNNYMRNVRQDCFNL